jgi:hypothetical protein
LEEAQAKVIEALAGISCPICKFKYSGCGGSIICEKFERSNMDNLAQHLKDISSHMYKNTKRGPVSHVIR